MAAIDGLIRAGVVRHDDLHAYVSLLGRHPGAPQARALVEYADPGAESAGESWQRLRIIDAGLPRPATQIHVVDEMGRDRYFDMGYPELLIASEYDGREFHTIDADRRHDVERRTYFERRYAWRFVIGLRETVFGEDDAFERGLGALLGMTPLPRRW